MIVGLIRVGNAPPLFVYRPDDFIDFVLRHRGLGEWVDQLDFSTLEKASSLFNSEELLGREDDVIWRVRFRDRGWLYIFLILEFQSAPDRWIALRIAVYQGLLWQNLIKQKIIKANDKLPPVMPVVLYNGEPPWDAPRGRPMPAELPA